jgi:transcription factor MYB, plant
MGLKKYTERDINKPSFKSYYKSNKLYRFDLCVPDQICKNPNDVYWTDLSIKMRIDVFACYNEFIKQYFKQFEIKWSSDKDNKLYSLIGLKKSWLDIGFDLSIHPVRCIKRYYYLENKNKSKWTKYEDDLLLDVIKKHGKGRWTFVSSFFKNRSRSQCLQRYKKLCECLNKGRWTKEEDEQLRQAVGKYFTKGWVYVSKFVDRRNDVQCRERWINALDPVLKKGRWSQEEDDKLLFLVEKHGENWNFISIEICGRNNNQCKRRYKILKKFDPQNK